MSERIREQWLNVAIADSSTTQPARNLFEVADRVQAHLAEAIKHLPKSVREDEYGVSNFDLCDIESDGNEQMPLAVVSLYRHGVFTAEERAALLPAAQQAVAAVAATLPGVSLAHVEIYSRIESSRTERIFPVVVSQTMPVGGVTPNERATPGYWDF